MRPRFPGGRIKAVEMTLAGDNKVAGKVDVPIEGKIRVAVSLKTGNAEARAL